MIKSIFPLNRKRREPRVPRSTRPLPALVMSRDYSGAAAVSQAQLKYDLSGTKFYRTPLILSFQSLPGFTNELLQGHAVCDLDS